MKLKKIVLSVVMLALAVTSVIPMEAQQAEKAAGKPVTMTVTANVANDKRMPVINADDIVIKQGKERLKATDWVAAKGDRAGLELFVLVDDSSDVRLGSQLNDLASFIKAQPPTTLVGVGYMRNGTVQIAQNLSTDHEAAAKSLRLPMGYAGAFGSPYLSAIDLMKRWPDTENRKEIVMITDGVDRARRAIPTRGLYVNPDVDSAAEVAMKTGTMIHTIYTPGTGHSARNYWRATSGQLDLAKLADITGGESYYLGLGAPVSFRPYLDQLQKTLDNQYLLSFNARPTKKADLRYVSLNTEVAGVDFGVADAVWVPAAN